VVEDSRGRYAIFCGRQYDTEIRVGTEVTLTTDTIVCLRHVPDPPKDRTACVNCGLVYVAETSAWVQKDEVPEKRVPFLPPQPYTQEELRIYATVDTSTLREQLTKSGRASTLPPVVTANTPRPDEPHTVPLRRRLMTDPLLFVALLAAISEKDR
jgi:hypothetical protein